MARRKIYPQKTVSYETWTKQDAQMAFGSKHVNRKVKYLKVDQYVRDMNNGHFVCDQVLIFDWYGQLIDGQHRTEAFIKSDAPTITWPVVRGADPDSQIVIDINTKRSLTDQLFMQEVRNAALVVSTVNNIIRIKENRMAKARRTFSPFDQLEVIAEHPEIRSSIDMFLWGQRNNMTPLMQSSLTTGHWLIAQENGLEEADAFIARVMTLQGEDAGSPVLALNRKVSQLRGRDTRRNGRAEIRMLVETWNADALGQADIRLEYRTKGPKPEDVAIPEVVARQVKMPDSGRLLLEQYAV